MNIMYDLTKHSNSGAKPDWRHAETFENRVLVAGAFLEIEAGGCPTYRWPRADEIYAPALIRPRVCCCIVIANADCACSIGRGHDLASNQAPFKKGGLEGIACACVKIPRKLGIKSASRQKILVDKKYNGSFKSTIVLRFSYLRP